jgi:hypothetical protein
LYRFVVNACVDRTRSGDVRAQTTDPAVLEELPAAWSLEEEFERHELAHSVQAAV